MKLNKIFRKTSIRNKLSLLYIFMSALIFLVNLYIYYDLNQMIKKIDEVYAGNIAVNEMTESLNYVQDSMTEFLKTKNTDALEQYYRYEQAFSNQLQDLSEVPGGNETEHLEGMVRALSNSYLKITNETVQAKRGRNVEKYSEGFEDATRLYGYINTYIASLNNERFINSTNNYEILVSSLRVAEIFSLSIIITIAVVCFVLVFLLTKSITSPLTELSSRADDIADGNFEGELIEVYNEDEIGVVTKAFNQMLVSIREYVVQIREKAETESAMKERELKMEAHLKDAQLKYLQAQINPHFLFNTLNAGAQLAMMEGAEKTNKYIQNMADFFRYNVRKNNDDVTLAEEIELIDNYMYIINVRFSGEINFKKYIDEELLDVRVPSMILQPIVENSVNYGVRNIDWDKYITLSLYREGDDACLCVDDNGVGIAPETIEKIMKRDIEPSSASKNSNGVGLVNVITRLEMYFDKADIFEMESDGENMGTRVTIRIPILKDNE